MADTPQSLTLKDNRDATEVYELWARRVFFALVLESNGKVSFIKKS